MNRWICLISLLSAHLLLAQNPGRITLDSLSIMDYGQLIEEFKNEKEPSKKRTYLLAYLQKAKKAQHYSKTVAGYKNLLHYSSVNLRLSYADSMVLTAKQSKDTALLASSYLTKGIVLYGNKLYQKAMENYLKADHLAGRVDASDYLRYKIKYNIGHINYYLGDYQEALELFTICLKFYGVNYPRPYLNILHSIALCYSHLGNYSASNYYNQAGLNAAIEIGNRGMDPYFKHCQGMNAFHVKSYQKAIDILCEVLPSIEGNNDFANVTLGKFYIGMSLWKLQRFDQAISYFKDVDSTFELQGYVKPEFRKAYQLLVTYYAQHNDKELEMYYAKRLHKADSAMLNSYKKLSTTVHREYNMAKLEEEKKALFNHFESLKQYGHILEVIALLLLCLILWWGAKNLALYTRVYKTLRGDTTLDTSSELGPSREDSGLLVADDTRQEIYKQLLEFERKKDYLQDINLGKLAAQFGTNSNTLSKVIHDTKDKLVSTYINDLKIEELMKILQRDKQTRYFNYKTLAQMLGYRTVSRLTRAFKSRTQTTIGEYIRQLEQNEKAEDVQS